MEEEAVILYCLTHSFLDNIEIADLARFEEALYQDMKIDEVGKALLEEIRVNKVLPDTEKLDSYITDFKKRFI